MEMLRVHGFDQLAGKQGVAEEKRKHHDDMEAQADDERHENDDFQRKIFRCRSFIHINNIIGHKIIILCPIM